MTSRPSFIATNCCVFCHEEFPLHFVSGPDAWQSVVRAVLYLKIEGKGSIELTKPTYLPSHLCDVNVALTGSPPTEIVEISRELGADQICERDRLAFCFHSWCYSILKWVSKWEVENSFVPVIYRLARALAPDPAIWEDIQERRHYLDSSSRLKMLANHEEQPLFMSRLPTELRTYVWRHTGLRTPYSTFLLVSVETSRLVGRLRSTPPRGLRQYQGPSLSANMVSIFGTEYIQDLTEDRDSEGNGYSIQNATQLKYITSVAGLCAIQFLGTDWESGWIGKIPSMDCAWHGIIRREVSSLRYGYSDLNCTAVSIAEPSPNSQVVWDQADFSTTLLDPDATLFDIERDVIRSVPRSTKQRFFRYLSLLFKDEYTRGLSVYFSGHGIVGLEAHFSRVSNLSGYREGCELHLSLCPGERIARVWLRIVNSPSSAFAAPALVIETTCRNLYTFGPYILPSMVVDNGYKWILLRHEGCVTGFYYENVKCGKTIMRLGVTGDGTALGTAPLQPQYHQCGFPSPQIGSPNAGLFISIAVLHGLERVDMCRVKNRCTGLMIHYHGSRTGVLGQWHASCASQSSCIYDSNSPAATDIYFKISSHKDRQIVTGVSFTPFMTEADPDSTYQVFSIREHIVWWFSKFYDEVSRWTGELQAIPDQSIMKQSM